MRTHPRLERQRAALSIVARLTCSRALLINEPVSLALRLLPVTSYRRTPAFFESPLPPRLCAVPIAPKAPHHVTTGAARAQKSLSSLPVTVCFRRCLSFFPAARPTPTSSLILAPHLPLHPHPPCPLPTPLTPVAATLLLKDATLNSVKGYANLKAYLKNATEVRPGD